MLKGGTAGQQTSESESGSTFGSFTRDGVRTVYATPKKSLNVRILPAFDASLSLEDEDFGIGVSSYRVEGADGIDEDTETEPFSDWFWPIEGYTYFGLGRKQFVSPLTGVPYFPPGHDPFRDLWVHIDKKITDVRIKQVAQGKTIIGNDGKEKKLQGYLSKTPRRFALMNVLVEDEKTRGLWENAVLVISQTTLRDLKDQLSKQTKKSDTIVITEEWEDYYLGDVTHPDHGCSVVVAEKYVDVGNNNSVRTCGFYFDQAPDSEETHKMNQMPITEEHLRGRYKIFDTDNVTNLPDKAERYQEMLDYIVEDGVIPLKVIEAACGRYGRINPELRVTNVAFYEGEAPLSNDGAGATTAAAPNEQTPTQTATSGGKLGGPKSSTPSQAPATSALEKKAAEQKEVVEEDVPMDDSEEPEAPKAEAEDTAEDSAGDEKKRARFQQLQEKLKAGEGLAADELTELSTLAPYAST